MNRMSQRRYLLVVNATEKLMSMKGTTSPESTKALHTEAHKVINADVYLDAVSSHRSYLGARFRINGSHEIDFDGKGLLSELQNIFFDILRFYAHR